MGHSSKKKKRGGGGGARRIKKDHNSHGGDVNDLLSEEITALRAIFQEDCKVVSDSPPIIKIKLRPYSKDAGYEDLDVSALLSVRCLPGYPYKCPKLQITLENGLSKADAENLLSLLNDQANSNAREGRVMIYNLVEASQEFLSEIVPAGQPHESVPCHNADRSSQLSLNYAADSCNKSCSSRGPFVYGFIDLFSGSGESWHWGLEVEDTHGINHSVHSHTQDGSNHGYVLENKNVQNVKPTMTQEVKQVPLLAPIKKLDTLEEESEDDSKNISASVSSRSLSGESVGTGTVAEAEDLFVEHPEETDDSDLESVSSVSTIQDQSSQTAERDLILAHLLRLACSSNGQLADALPEITSELYNLGIVSERVQDLVTKPSSVFDHTFDQVFGKQMVTSKVSQFWKTASDSGGQNTSVIPSSRYLNDFEELQPLGHGGFGHVVLCKNKLDGRQYAVKKIRLKDKGPPDNDRILREVATLSRLQHQHVVRYYQAWYETGFAASNADAACGSWTAVSSSFSYKGVSSADNENKLESTYLYIQMEYCPRTLRQMFESYNHFDKDLAWHLFRQIVEGLGHIHGQGIIHRDLTPNNIFFDARNDIKIGDFGLAKFLKREQLDQDPDPAETAGVSVDRTGQVGTYFYTAPEIEQGWPKIDEKADMYSLGIVFFELWHPFGTAMERHVVLSDLKLKGELPAAWVSEFPDQASLLRHLMSPIPSERPSATELIQHAFPPQMEYELLDNILRTMHSSEDTSVYDKVVTAIFNEEMISTKDQHEHVGKLGLARNDTSSVQYTDFDTEVRDQVLEVAMEVFRQHCAKHLEIIPMRLQGDCPQLNKNAVKLLTHGGDKIELCHELRLPFVNWVIANQKAFFKRYEISYVYRRAIGHSPPNRYLQGDFDIIGGASALTEAEVLKATMDTINRFFNSELCDIHLNHGDLLDAIWSWIGIKIEHRQKVAELLSLLGSLRPQSSERKSKWVVIRRQLRQELNLAEAAVNRLQMVGLRFCGVADQALPRLRGALPADKLTRKALDELSELFSYLRVWRIEKHMFIDALMPPAESYHRDLFFQIYLRKENNPASVMEGTVLAVGGRYDYLLNRLWARDYKSNPPGAVGVSIALETIIQHCSADIRPFRGGGLLEERMELVAELWEENIKAEFVPVYDPSLTEQYEYANEHDIKCLVIVTDTGVSQKGSVKVRHLELKKEKEVDRENLVKFLLEAMTAQFRNPSIWN
ncbi:eIF-2-alpha kinase GCN2 isoform X2 [Actinidia eriantha]|uniref:eIF-2-alpha kinase GCN2 isoform X2 n=1 Tax=Actinidia eriantha TaxID=165200 RepID=UPI0025891879|nr:eIF-2-alpha kinase GCN2 isoform X2 [Actinidia eriantha]